VGSRRDMHQTKYTESGYLQILEGDVVEVPSVYEKGHSTTDSALM